MFQALSRDCHTTRFGLLRRWPDAFHERSHRLLWRAARDLRNSLRALFRLGADSVLPELALKTAAVMFRDGLVGTHLTGRTTACRLSFEAGFTKLSNRGRAPSPSIGKAMGDFE